MSTFEFLHNLRQSGVRVWLEGDRLRCVGPEQLLMSDLTEQLKERKQEIIAFLRSAANSGSGNSSSIMDIQPLGSRNPFFAVPGHNGDVFCYVDLARHLSPDQPFFALQAPGLEPDQAPLSSIEGIAAIFARDIIAMRPQGPYLLGGYCVGGTIAFELAQQLTAKGHQVSVLILFSSMCPTALALRYRARVALRNFAGRFQRHGAELSRRKPNEWLQYLRERTADRRADRKRVHPNPLRQRLGDTTVQAFKIYQPQPGSFPIHMFLPNSQPDSPEDRLLDWGLFANKFTMTEGPADGELDTMLLEPNVSALAKKLKIKFEEFT
jgi:thioesterase domain-containing protein